MVNFTNPNEKCCFFFCFFFFVLPPTSTFWRKQHVRALKPSLKTFLRHWLYTRRNGYRFWHILTWFIQVYSSYCRYLLFFLPRYFRRTLTENTHSRRWREPKGLDSPKWMRQIRTVQYTFGTSWVHDWRLRRRKRHLLYQDLKPRHDTLSLIFSLGLQFGFSHLFEFIFNNLSGKRIM